MDPNLKPLLGTFAQYADAFSMTDLDGELTDKIIAGETVVHGPWKVVTKDQIARITGIVTESMCNAQSADGHPVYEFQGNGWKPQASIGDILLQDVNNPTDRWASKPGFFGGAAWTGRMEKDLSVTYTKRGEPLIAIEVPKGTFIDSLEGPRPAPAGCLLTCEASKGNFIVWTADVVEKYIKPYND
jgi:hypothetical protein